jgi:ribonuclease P protein component
VQILVSVSKKKIKKATERNLIRRRIKEAYRLNKNINFNQNNSTKNNFALGIIYLSKEIESYEKINKSIQRLLHEFYENYQ